MDLYHLKTFLTLAKIGHFKRAADELFITQPAVSIHIKTLEEYYGFSLFEKVDQKYVLTAPGRILYEYAEKLFNILNEAKRSLDGFNNLNSGSLFIGASSNIGVYSLPKVIGEFKNNYPNIDIKVSVGPSNIIERKLLSNEIDIGIIEAPIRSADVVTTCYWEEKLVLIVSPRHIWAGVRKVHPSQLKNEVFIVGERGTGTRRVLKNALGDIVDDINVYLELGSTEAVKKAVEENLGISIVLECAVIRELKHKTLKAISINGVNLKKRISIVHLKGKYLTPSFMEFLKFIQKDHLCIEICAE